MDPAFQKVIRKTESLESRHQQHPWRTRPELQTQYAELQRKLKLEDTIQELEGKIKSASQDLAMMQQLKAMKRVLRRLKYTTKANVIDLKGRVACEISTCDELIATELMFGGVFSELTPTQIVALSSCLVFGEKV